MATKENDLEIKRSKSAYNANDLKTLKGLEAVRLRPGMYIGSTDCNGTHQLLWEIIDNAVDEANAGYGKKITIVLHEDGSAQVTDEGRGIPCDHNDKDNIDGLDIVFGTLHGGGKFDDSLYKTAGGLHGVGSAVCNALSTKLEVRVYKDGTEYFDSFSDGGKLTTKTKVIGPTSKRGSEIRFWPDAKVFNDIRFNYERIALHLEDSACLTSGVTFVLIDERTKKKETFYYEDGILEYLNKKIGTKDKVGEPIFIEGEFNEIQVSFACAFLQGEYKDQIFAFANNIRNIDGGTHVSGLKKALTRAFNDYATNHEMLKGNKKLEGDDIREGFISIIAVKIPEKYLQFEGQVKSKLGSPVVSPAVENVIYSNLNYYLEEHAEQANEIIKRALDAMTLRQKTKNFKDSLRLKNVDKSAANLSGKLVPAQSKEYHKCELFIVEGDSAGGSAKKCRDNKYQAILPLRGKPKNVTNSSNVDDLFDNQELSTLIYTIGAEYDDKFNCKNIHYDKVIIMTDADDDGAHIQNLLLSFFFTHMKPLVEEGHVYLAVPPLYRLFNKDKEIYCWSNQELEEARGKMKNYLISRYKGLGEMDAEQLGLTTMNPETRTLIQVSIDDFSEAEDNVELFMGKDSGRRHKWITENIDFSFKGDYLMEVKLNEKEN